MFINRRIFLASGPTGILALATGEEGKLAAIVESSRRAWEVPGLAVAIVRGDDLEYLEGHGVRRQGDRKTITPDTLFPLGSCTKAFTTAALALLADEKKLSWDDRVRKHVSFFRLSDALADNQVSLRDLLCHRTGVGTHDLLWYRAAWAPEEAVRRVGHLPLDRPFRSAFQYQSTMFTAAGLAVAKASESSWEEIIARRLFAPLGMKTAGDSTAKFRSDDRAAGHRFGSRGELVPFPDWHPFPRPDAAGSIHVSARDLCAWLRFHLNTGVHAGQRLVSAANLDETHTPQMVIPLVGTERRLHPDATQMSYGLAWVIQDYHGYKIIAHAGVIEGFRVQLTLVPKARLGIAVLANLHATRMNLALTYRLLDNLLDMETRDWDRHMQDVVRDAAASDAKARQGQFARRKENTRPSLDIDDYVGDYHHPAYSKTTVTRERGQLVWRFSSFTLPLEHFHFDTFVAILDNYGPVFLTFVFNERGEVHVLEVGVPLHVSFQRKSHAMPQSR